MQEGLAAGMRAGVSEGSLRAGYVLAWSCRLDTHNEFRSAATALSGAFLITIYANGS